MMSVSCFCLWHTVTPMYSVLLYSDGICGIEAGAEKASLLYNSFQNKFLTLTVYYRSLFVHRGRCILIFILSCCKFGKFIGRLCEDKGR